MNEISRRPKREMKEGNSEPDQQVAKKAMKDQEYRVRMQ